MSKPKFPVRNCRGDVDEGSDGFMLKGTSLILVIGKSSRCGTDVVYEVLQGAETGEVDLNEFIALVDQGILKRMKL